MSRELHTYTLRRASILFRIVCVRAYVRAPIPIWFGAYEVANNPHIFLTLTNQHIQEISRHFDETLNIFFPLVFAENLEQHDSHTFMYMLL